MSALDRIRYVTLLDVRPGDVLMLEIDPSFAESSEEPGPGQNPLDAIGEIVRTELDRIGHEKVGLLIVTRGTVTAKVVRPDPMDVVTPCEDAGT